VETRQRESLGGKTVVSKGGGNKEINKQNINWLKQKKTGRDLDSRTFFPGGGKNWWSDGGKVYIGARSSRC